MKKISSLVIFASLLISSIAMGSGTRREVTEITAAVDQLAFAVKNVQDRAGTSSANSAKSTLTGAITRLSMAFRNCNSTWHVPCAGKKGNAAKVCANGIASECSATLRNAIGQKKNQLTANVRSQFVIEINKLFPGQSLAQIEPNQSSYTQHAQLEIESDTQVQ